MKDLRGKIAVVTGGGTGMGRALVLQLAAEGAHVAFCDFIDENCEKTTAEAEASARLGARVTSHHCDVSDEAQVLAFRDEVKAQHQTDHVNLVFNNAGIAGGGSFLTGPREEWEKTFGVCWFGVYYCSRAFLPLLVASPEGALVNTSSVNGFWATLGQGQPHTAYSAAKFAVKGFTEALMNDCRTHAPHVQVALVMPGHVGTSITHNSRAVLGKPPISEMSAQDIEEVRAQLKRMGMPGEGLSDDQIRAAIHQRMESFRDDAPLSSEQAATIILDGVREGRWRILVGDDAHKLDDMVRAEPESAYEPGFLRRFLAGGHFRF